MPDALFRVARDGVCLDAVIFDELPGLNRSLDIVGHSLYQTLPSDLGDPIRMWLEAPTASRANKEIECAHRRYRVACRAAKDGSSWIRLQDVTERQRLEQELQQAQKMASLGQAACGMVHDFNNFLTVIRGQSERLERSLAEGDRRRKWAASVLRVTERARVLTAQLLSFGGRQSRDVSVTDLNATVKATRVLLEQLVGDNIELRLSLADDLWPVLIEGTHLEQVLFNLAANARDAMPGTGSLEIGTHNVTLGFEESRGLSCPPGSYVSLWVTDSGQGMDLATQRDALEPFFTTKARGQGTGIGLSTVQRLLRQHDGQVTVSSQLGLGTTVRLYLPKVERRHRDRDRRRTSEDPPALPPASLEMAGLTVLVAEDQPDVRDVFREDLEGVGCTVLAARDGPEALRVSAAHDGKIDVLVSDVVMPEMNGRDLARRLAELRPNLITVLVSAYPDSELGRQGLVASEMCILHKPIAGRELIDHIRRICADAGAADGETRAPDAAASS